MNANTEEWRPIPGFEGYYSVSSTGLVRSETRTIRHTSGKAAVRKGRLMSTSEAKGYRIVQLCKDGKVYCRGVHTLVLRAFVGDPPAGHEACHADGNRANNMLSNLRWDTRSGNFSDMVLHGTRRRGLRHHNCKLTPEQVRSIRSDQRTLKAIADEYGITYTNVSCIRSRKSWAWLD